MAEREYKRLTRMRMRRRGFFQAFATRSNLWLGKDHLLSIDSNGYTEDYKRFYFRDIQAVIIRRNKRRVVWNCVLGVLTLPCLVGLVTLLFSDGSEIDGIISFSIITAVVGVPLLINNLLGSTCACYLRTAVQVEELPSLSRIGRVHKVMNRIRPLIAEAQGQLAPEEISLRMRDMLQSSAGGVPSGNFIVDDPNAPPRMVG